MLKNIQWKRFILPILLLFLFAALFLAAFLLGIRAERGEILASVPQKILPRSSPPQDVDLSLFWEIWETLHQEYVDTSRLDPQKLLFGAIEGMVRGVGDPYTEFLDPKKAKQFLEDAQGNFEGVGTEIGVRNGVLTVIAPLKGTPAERAGLRAEDQILKIDDALTARLSLEESVAKIRGPKGTTVLLTIARGEEILEIPIVRDTIIVPSLAWSFEDGIAHIELFNFAEQLPLEFRKVASEISPKGLSGIILDLRNNPGGYLDASVEIAGWFVNPGEVIVIEEFGNGRRTLHRSEGSGALKDIPLVVLINGGSASASEILAGALKELRGVTLVGEKTFGKGSVQALEDFRLDTALKITVARWLTPQGHSIMDNGIAPDIPVPMTEEDYKERRDPQLDRAKQLLGAILISE